MPRGVDPTIGQKLVLEGSRPLQSALSLFVALTNVGAFATLDVHARRVIVCQCEACKRGREIAADVANLVIEHQKSGLFPPDLVATAKAFNKGKEPPAAAIEIAR